MIEKTHHPRFAGQESIELIVCYRLLCRVQPDTPIAAGAVFGMMSVVLPTALVLHVEGTTERRQGGGGWLG